MQFITVVVSRGSQREIPWLVFMSQCSLSKILQLVFTSRGSESDTHQPAHSRDLGLALRQFRLSAVLCILAWSGNRTDCLVSWMKTPKLVRLLWLWLSTQKIPRQLQIIKMGMGSTLACLDKISWYVPPNITTGDMLNY